MKYPVYSGLVGFLALASAPLFALSGSSASVAGDLDTVLPTPGVASVPASGNVTGTSIPYAGATDSSGISRVELWTREDTAAWGFSSLVVIDGNPTGSFIYVPAGSGTYHFELVAEDTVGNRSGAPSGSTGIGQGSTDFSTNVADWSVLDR